MGLRMRLHDGEPIVPALRRFKKLVEREYLRRKPYEPSSWPPERRYFVRNTEKRRYKAWKKWYVSQKAALLARYEGIQPALPR